MITAVDFEDCKVAVLGLGRSGVSAARSLARGGAQVICWDDDHEVRRERQRQGFHLLAPEDIPWAETRALIPSPGVAGVHRAVEMARRAGVAIMGDLELFARATPGAVVAVITGSNGKSTTAALLAHVLEACKHRSHLGGNIGVPVLDLPSPQEGAVYVLEVSSYQAELIESLEPRVAVQLNIFPDHIERHGSLDAYAAAKARLFCRQNRADAAIIGIDDAYGLALARRLQDRARVITVSTRGKADIFVREETLFETTDNQTQEICSLEGLDSLFGLHNGQNVAAAYGAARFLGCEVEAIIRALHTFEGLPHRMEFVRRLGGVCFINDSKATNASAAACALSTYRRIHWIAGGVAKRGGIGGVDAAYGECGASLSYGGGGGSFCRSSSCAL